MVIIYTICRGPCRGGIADLAGAVTMHPWRFTLAVPSGSQATLSCTDEISSKIDKNRLTLITNHGKSMKNQ